MYRNFIFKHALFVILFQFFLFGINGQNQVKKPAQTNKSVTTSLSKKVTINVPGTLDNFLSTSEKNTLSSLTLSGLIDQRDFIVMNEKMPALTTIDLNDTKIAAYENYAANELPRNAYKGNMKLEKITLPPSITNIGASSFYRCSSLQELHLPSSVIKIGEDAFYFCGIRQINIPEGLSKTWMKELHNCKKLTVVSADSHRYSMHMGVIYSQNFDTLYFCPRGKRGDIDDLEIYLHKVKVIGSLAFCTCENLTGTPQFNHDLVVIDRQAFQGCSKLTGDVEIPESVRRIGTVAFSGCYNLSSVTIPKKKLIDDLTTDGCYYANDAFDYQFEDKLKIGKVVDNGIPDKKVYPSTSSTGAVTTQQETMLPPESGVAGKEATYLKYDKVFDFSEGLARVKLGDKVGLIDTFGKEIIPPKYDFIFPLSEDVMSVSLDKKSGFLDKTGKVIIPLKYDNTSNFSEGLAMVQLGQKYGFIDKTGKVVISLKYDYASPFYKGKATVRLDGRYFRIDKTEKEVNP